jgi:hypothetical protein
VLPDVEGVPLVLLDADPLQQLGPKLGENSGFAKQLEPNRGPPGAPEKLRQLVLDALGRNAADQRRRATHRVERRGRNLILKARGELRGPQHP